MGIGLIAVCFEQNPSTGDLLSGVSSSGCERLKIATFIFASVYDVFLRHAI